MRHKIITKAGRVGFKNIHKPRKRSFIGGDLPPHAGSDGKESKFVRCKQCGFLVDTERHTEGSGWGNERADAITTIAGGTANAKNPVVTGGCPLCGSSEFK